jgi:hypothetical protein
MASTSPISSAVPARTEPVVVVHTAWLDSGHCSMMSSWHSPEAAVDGIPRRVVGHAGRVARPGPALALDYGTKMCGCDVSDQRRAAHSTQKRTFKWFHPLFYWVLDNAMTNAILDYAILTGQPHTSVNVKEYFEAVSDALTRRSDAEPVNSPAKKAKKRSYLAAPMITFG